MSLDTLVNQAYAMVGQNGDDSDDPIPDSKWRQIIQALAQSDSNTSTEVLLIVRRFLRPSERTGLSALKQFRDDYKRSFPFMSEVFNHTLPPWYKEGDIQFRDEESKWLSHTLWTRLAYHYLKTSTRIGYVNADEFISKSDDDKRAILRAVLQKFDFESSELDDVSVHKANFVHTSARRVFPSPKSRISPVVDVQMLVVFPTFRHWTGGPAWNNNLENANFIKVTSQEDLKNQKLVKSLSDSSPVLLSIKDVLIQEISIKQSAIGDIMVPFISVTGDVDYDKLLKTENKRTVDEYRERNRLFGIGATGTRFMNDNPELRYVVSALAYKTKKLEYGTLKLESLFPRIDNKFVIARSPFPVSLDGDEAGAWLDVAQRGVSSGPCVLDLTDKVTPELRREVLDLLSIKNAGSNSKTKRAVQLLNSVFRSGRPRLRLKFIPDAKVSDEDLGESCTVDGVCSTPPRTARTDGKTITIHSRIRRRGWLQRVERRNRFAPDASVYAFIILHEYGHVLNFDRETVGMFKPLWDVYRQRADPPTPTDRLAQSERVADTFAAEFIAAC